MAKVKSTEFAMVCKIDGFKELSQTVSKMVGEQKAAFISIALHGMKIGELVNTFAENPELRKQVDEYNEKRQKNKLGGAPRKYHGVVAEKLVEDGACFSKKWLEKCARAHSRMMELGMDRDQIGKLPMSAVDQSPMAEEFLPSAFTDGDDGETIEVGPDGKTRLTFKDFLKRTIARLDSIREAGEVSLKNKKNQEQLASALEEWLSQRGCKCSITIKQ